MLPIIGPRTLDQLTNNLKALEFALSSEHLQRLDQASAFKLGFPHDVVAETAPALAGGKLELIDFPVRPVR